MNKKTKKIIVIISLFLLSLFLFDLVVGCGSLDGSMEYAIENNTSGSQFMPIGVFLLAGIIHCMFVILVAIILHFTKIDKTYKKIVAYSSVYSIVLSLPMGVLSMYFAHFLNIFNL